MTASRKVVLITLGGRTPNIYNRELQHRLSGEVMDSLLFELLKACLDRP